MRTPKKESNGNTLKRSSAKRSSVMKQRFINEPSLSEEEIRELAEIFFHDRIQKGETGSAEDDWLKAEKYLKSYQNPVSTS